MSSIFITGTDTNVGKTLVSSLFCYQLKYDYFKPIQTGECRDKLFVSDFLKGTDNKVFEEAYYFKKPASPHISAKFEGAEIYMDRIKLPKGEKLIVEGSGGVLVPINDKYYIIDLIKYLNLPVVVVARTALGTINHTLLTLEALSLRKIEILGVVLNGEKEVDVFDTISNFAKILLHIPTLKDFNELKSQRYYPAI